MAINDIFKGFYTNLYKAEKDFDEPICKQYLDKLELPRISQIDKESLEAYRPISLIPCDLKIYAKVFASRMEKVIHSLIKEDQTGFIKGRNASDNMRRLLHILDFADSHPTPCAVFSLDAEKAFDRLDYMWAVLQCFSASVNTSFL